MRIKTGDKIKVMKGKDKGKTGKVLQVFVAERKLSIDGVNLMIKHMKTRQEGQKGQKIQYPSPIAIENVMLLCPKCNKPTRVGKVSGENKKNIRQCVKCKENIT